MPLWLHPRERALDSNWTGGQDNVEIRDSSAIEPVASHYTKSTDHPYYVKTAQIVVYRGALQCSGMSQTVMKIIIDDH
jgi:hypothetical protein